MKPIAQHNAEMEAHSRKWFVPDPGKIPVAFVYRTASACWIASRREIPAAPGWLNYDGKIEISPEVDGKTTVILRRDMTTAEFEALPIADEPTA